MHDLVGCCRHWTSHRWLTDVLYMSIIFLRTESYASINSIPSNVLFLRLKSLQFYHEMIQSEFRRKNSRHCSRELQCTVLSIGLSQHRYAPGSLSRSHISQIIWIACNCLLLKLQHASSSFVSTRFFCFRKKNRELDSAREWGWINKLLEKCLRCVGGDRCILDILFIYSPEIDDIIFWLSGLTFCLVAE